MPATIVLVHGAFAESASWNGVIEELHPRGYTVISVANPLRGLQSGRRVPAQRPRAPVPRPDRRSPATPTAARS